MRAPEANRWLLAILAVTALAYLPALGAGVRISLVAFVAAAFFHPAGYHFYFFYIAGLAVSLRLIANSIRPRAAAAPALRAA